MLQRARDEVLVARRSVLPAPPDVTEAVEAEIKRMKEAGEMRDRAQEASQRPILRDQYQKRALTVPPMAAVGFMFQGFRTSGEDSVYIRFKPRATGGHKEVAGAWVFYRPMRTEGGKVELAQMPAFEGLWSTSGTQEIGVPGVVVDEAGIVRMAYYNYQPDTGVQFDPKDGIEIMQRTEGFFPNYYRALLVILFHVVLLAAVALMTGAGLSFPVATFTVGAIVFVGLVAPWVAKTGLTDYVPGPGDGIWKVIGGYAKNGIGWVLKGVFFLVPQFTRFGPIEDLVNGRLVGWDFVGKAAAVMCALKGTVAMLLASYFYARRELARVIV